MTLHGVSVGRKQASMVGVTLFGEKSLGYAGSLRCGLLSTEKLTLQESCRRMLKILARNDGASSDSVHSSPRL